MKPLWSLVCCFLFAVQSFASKSHPITTLLNAKWHTTPICLEISEFLFDESPNLYWDYVSALNTLSQPLHELDTDAKVYKSAVSVAEKLIGPIQLSLLKLVLSMHTMSPRVQAHFQVAREVLEQGDCKTDIFITIGSRVACSLDELKKGLEKAKNADKQDQSDDIYSFDHIYPGSENNTITAILYGEIGSKNFKTFHEYLTKQAESGLVKYVSRHFVRDTGLNRVRLSGYGVELYLKSTEYKSQDDSPRSDDSTTMDDSNDVDNEVEGFDFKILKDRHPSLAHSLDRLRSSLLEKTDEIAPLKAWEFQDLGLQAAERVAQIQGEEALQILQFTAQNFPSQAKSLLHVRVSDDFKKEMKHNTDVLGKELNFQPPDAALYVNGLYFDAESLDVGNLVETLRGELRVLSGLHKLKLEGSVASDLLALDLSQPDNIEFAVDIRDSAVAWINNIETDAKYRTWPGTVYDLLRPSFPGMVRSIRKNIFNLLVVIDPIKPDGREITKLVESFVVHSAPIRVGVVFDTRKADAKSEKVYRSLICAWNYINQVKKPRDALSFLTDLFAFHSSDEDISLSTIRKQFEKSAKELNAEQVDEVLGEDSDYDYGRQLATEFVERLGFEKSPQALLNGVPLEETLLNEKKFEEAVLSEVLMATVPFQKAVFNGQLTDDMDVVDYIMTQSNVMPRLNQRIMTKEDASFVDFSGEPHKSLENIKLLAQLSARDMTATLLHNLKYFTTKNSEERALGKKISFLTIWIVTDVTTEQGAELLKNALLYMKSTSGIRVAFIPNTEGVAVADRSNLNRLVWSAVNTLPGSAATSTVLEWLEKKSTEKAIPSEVNEVLSESELHLKMLRVYSQRVLQLKASQSAVISNGKILGPLNEKEVFVADDFALIERLHSFLHGDKIREALKKYDDIEESDSLSTDDSDLIMKLIGLLVPRQSRTRVSIPSNIRDSHTVVNLPPKQSNMPYIEVFAALDPASRGAQKLAPILILLRNVVNCNMRVVLSVVEKHSDMPVKNFYRFVIEPELQFNPDGKYTLGPYAKFVGLPSSSLLTQNLQVPENWLVEVVRSVYDLDNIKLIDINGPVHSEYELEYLLLEGHCFDATTGSPPRGLQITLGTDYKPVVVDTIVMANLGYFQLKANPGAWILRLRHGRSADIYDITNADGPNSIHSPDGTRVIISSFRSHVIKLRVTKKKGKERADLLADDDEANSGIWNSITSSFSGSNPDANESETINIFSVASGHLYERLLRIMMLSLMKHTNSPVKFWFLKNFLSPQFIDFLPHMAKEYNFQYELVQYKWPRWLHQQTEKQRIIWGYKILFLDVLFPLDVKKIIFVDADAIVRSDINELNTMDLGGAPYAYTPFCDSRKDMDGFRFWKQGYWRNHLQGRKYHISALYVVDLKRFRKIAAGDRLRGQYQALSQDPNSLSNLDQDLPNNMIHQVAIKSLPQEWLYCQTWCHQRDFANAKVIDLCNDPQTKEPKLTAAQRIVPEWKDYDAEIKNLLNRVQDQEHEEEVIEPEENIPTEAESKYKADDSDDKAKHTEL